jgi:hypothetical protein
LKKLSKNKKYKKIYSIFKAIFHFTPHDFNTIKADPCNLQEFFIAFFEQFYKKFDNLTLKFLKHFFLVVKKSTILLRYQVHIHYSGSYILRGGG